VPGVGEKTAAKLINQYGGLDGIFAHVDQQTPKLRESLIANEERARKNLDLMLLRRDAPLDTVDFDSLAVAPKPDEVKRLFDFLEFRTFADRLAEALGPAAGIATSYARRTGGRGIDGRVAAAAARLIDGLACSTSPVPGPVIRVARPCSGWRSSCRTESATSPGCRQTAQRCALVAALQTHTPSAWPQHQAVDPLVLGSVSTCVV
jgi:hypothetical protein